MIQLVVWGLGAAVALLGAQYAIGKPKTVRHTATRPQNLRQTRS